MKTKLLKSTVNCITDFELRGRYFKGTVEFGDGDPVIMAEAEIIIEESQMYTSIEVNVLSAEYLDEEKNEWFPYYDHQNLQNAIIQKL